MNLFVLVVCGVKLINNADVCKESLNNKQIYFMYDENKLR